MRKRSAQNFSRMFSEWELNVHRFCLLNLQEIDRPYSPYVMPLDPLPNGLKPGLPEEKHYIRAPERTVLKFGGTSIGKFHEAVARICL